AKNSTEVIMTFSGEVEFKSPSTPNLSEARKKIEKQLDHLFGPMSFATYYSVPRGNHEVTNVKIRSEGRKVYHATYDYKGTIVVKNGPTTKYDVTLAINPDTIYEAGMVRRYLKKTYPCTDHHYQSEGDFWYFWNPLQPGCPLKEGRDYKVVTTSIQRIKNTVKTFPEYSRLEASDGKIEIHLLMGMDEPDKNSHDPRKSRDINADNWREFRGHLLQMGFTEREWSDQEIFEIVPRGTERPFVTEYSKKNATGLLVLRLFFGPSGIDEKSKAFHYFMKDAVDNASVFIYDGHSGLGGHLDLESIENAEGFKFAPNKKKYQIYFFDSCTSYTYYNTMYFDRKATSSDPKGSKNLDIMTNGLSTLFDVMSRSNLPVVKAIDAWMNHKGSVSYQDLAQEIDSRNLYGINGDEDNPTSP
ncbi:MAG: hypothetical protein AABZ55_14435, partial [Bdellovibrionota bacterium]